MLKNEKSLYLHPLRAKISFTVKMQLGTLAQLVEQRTENPCVPGSIPGGTTKNATINVAFFFVKW